MTRIVLLVDNNSPFTANLKEIVTDLGYNCDCRLFSEMSRDNLVQDNSHWFDMVILSGRRNGSSHINMVNSAMVKYCYARNIPILGICYGSQIIALTLGGTLRKLENPVKDYGHVTIKSDNPLVSNKAVIRVFKSHKFCVSRLPFCLQSVGESSTCSNEIFIHPNKPLFGTQFHPEISGADGKNILTNFLAVV